MSSWLSFALLAAAAVLAISEGRAIPAEPVSVMMDSRGNPVLFVREKRAPANLYPHRAMMFTGYYRPVRRTDGQATGVFAQGNAVSGNSYLGDGQQPDYLQRGPEPIDESDVSSAEAEAAPNPLEHHVDEEEQHNYPAQEEQHDQQDSHDVQEEEQEPSVYTTEVPVAEEPEVQSTAGPKRPTKKQGPKKTKKKPVVVESEEEEEDESEEEEDDEDDDEPAVPFVPFKSNRRRQGNVPNLNNFFPMVFSFPRGISRGGSSSPGSPPGMITAIANSYSTGKGGIASSVATAYGGSPQGKKQRRAQPAQE